MHKNPQILNIILTLMYVCNWTLYRTNIVSETKRISKCDKRKWTCWLIDMKVWTTQTRAPISPIRNTLTCVVSSFRSNGAELFEVDIIQQNNNYEIHIFNTIMSKLPEFWKVQNDNFHWSSLCADNGNKFVEGHEIYQLGQKICRWRKQWYFISIQKFTDTHEWLRTYTCG